MKKTLVIGSCVCDVSIYLEHLPGTEEDINPHGQRMALGGCAYNVSNMLRLMHVPYLLYAPIGTGIFGDFVKEHLEKQGVVPARSSEEENGACYCLIDEKGNRSFMAVHGAEYHIHKEWLDEIDMSEYDMIYVCGLEIEETTGEEIISFLEEHRDKKIVFASGPRILSIQKDRMKRILNLHPLWHLNYREGRSYLNNDTYSKEETVNQLHAFNQNTVIMTDGSHAITVYEEQGVRSFDPIQVTDIIDGNGAGDAHIGTVMACLHMDMTLDEAILKANQISAAVIHTRGAVLLDEEYQRMEPTLLKKQ